jgi:hypothetical protein
MRTAHNLAPLALVVILSVLFSSGCGLLSDSSETDDNAFANLLLGASDDMVIQANRLCSARPRDVATARKDLRRATQAHESQWHSASPNERTGLASSRQVVRAADVCHRAKLLMQAELSNQQAERQAEKVKERHNHQQRSRRTATS